MHIDSALLGTSGISSEYTGCKGLCPKTSISALVLKRVLEYWCVYLWVYPCCTSRGLISMLCEALWHDYKRVEQKNFYFGDCIVIQRGSWQAGFYVGICNPNFCGVDTILIISTGFGICLRFLTLWALLKWICQMTHIQSELHSWNRIGDSTKVLKLQNCLWSKIVLHQKQNHVCLSVSLE